MRAVAVGAPPMMHPTMSKIPSLAVSIACGDKGRDESD
jgi:hypothetical protein